MLKVCSCNRTIALDAKALERGGHLPDAGVAAARPDLGGHEEPLADAERGDELAHHGLRAAVHRRGIDDVAVQEPEHLAQRRARGGIVADVEGLPGAQADFRQVLVFCERAFGHEGCQRGEKGSAAGVHEHTI